MAISRKLTRALTEQLNLTEEEVKSLSKAGWTADKMRKATPDELQLGVLKASIQDRPAARVQYTLITWMGDDGEIDHEARYSAYLQAEKMQEEVAEPRPTSGGLPIAAAAIGAAFVPEGTSAGLHHDNSGWISLGPHHVGGRTRAIVIDPNNGDRIYAASVAGGIWLSEDGGDSWVPTQDLMANMAIASLVMDPTNSSTLYAGTGEGFYIITGAEGVLGAGLPGLGIFKSEDGWSWSLLQNTEVTKSNEDFKYVNDLAISSDGKTLLAATGTGIHRSIDSGQTWTKVRASSGTGVSGCVFIDPGDDNKAIAAGRGFAAFSTDGGANWTDATTPGMNGRVQLSYAQGDSSVVYACVNNHRSEIWRSTDGGVTYTKQKATGASKLLGGQGNYANAIWAFAGATRSKDVVLAAGLDIYRSINGGDRFTKISDWSASQRTHNSAHADHHIIVPHADFDNKNNKTVYFGNDGGVYKAADYSTTATTTGWENINNGYAVTQFYRGAGNVRSKVIIGGAQDNGTQGHTPGNYRWDRKWVWLGDGTIAIADPTDTSTFYGAYPTGHLFRATRNITTVNYPDGDTQLEGIWAQVWPSPPGAGDMIWLTPFVLDLNDNDVMFAGGSRKLYRSSSISSATDQLTARWKRIMQAPTSITDIAVADTTDRTGIFLSNRVLIGTRRGQVWLSDNANIADADIDLNDNKPEWRNITGDINAHRGVTRLFIDPQNTDTFYACYGGFQTGNLWKTTNAGGIWIDSSDGLPPAPIYGITVHPQNSDWVYVATEAGLYASENGGQTWSVTNEGPANVSCADLFWLNRTLVCVTHARGIFQIDLDILGIPDALLASDVDGTVYVLDGETGVVGNRLAIPNAGSLTGVVAISESEELRNSMGAAAADVVVNTAYVADVEGNVYCVDTNNLTLKWHENVGGAIAAKPEVWLSPDDKSIYLLVSSVDGKLTALELTDNHRQAWTVNLPGFNSGSKIWSNRVMDNWAYISSEAGIYAVRLLGGRAVAWEDTTVSCTAPSMLAAGVVYVPTDLGVVAYQSRSGKRKWFIGEAPVKSQPVWSIGAVVFGTDNGRLIGVDHRRGTKLFEILKSGGLGDIAVDDDMLYYVVTGTPGTPTSIRQARLVPSTGLVGNWSLNEQWSVDLPKGTSGPPVIVDDPDDSAKVFVTTGSHKAKCFDSVDGGELWSINMDSATAASLTPIWPERN